MSTPPLFVTTSKSTLMHACLASVSPEILTLDNIIRATPRVFLPHKVALPTEILLLIREWLFPDITNILTQQSTAALEAYEHSLRNLLCPDCIAYNLDIFGPNIWHWEHFNGPCACLEVDDIPSAGYGPHNHPQFLKPVTSPPPTPKPNEFTNAQEWLESHLSREAVSRLKSQSLRIPRMTLSHRFPQIWELVSLILEEFDCHFLPDPEDLGEGTSNHPGPEPPRPRRHDLVQVISSIATTLSTSREFQGREQAMLRRATRDLCLESTEPFGAHDRDTSSFKGLLWRPNRGEAQEDREQVQLLFSVLAAGAAACFSLPITFTTVAITIVCFYSKPRSFRII